MMSSTSKSTRSKKTILLSAIFAMAVLLLGASSSAISAKAWAQAPTADIKSKAKEIENTVISALKSYATGIGAKYIDLDLLTQAPPTTGNNTGGGVPTVVNQTAYTDAMNMIAKAQNQLQSLSQTANPQQATLIAKAQGGVEALKTLMERKAPINLAEDVAQSPIVNNLRQLS
ncbi:hypothetical protein NTE_03408 [Candidatus Nitrososphaera evergladensis SR1]|uniref:Uncharacterized protein n=1 Tax=Candidatus Nitrososphaera evergladensis SR1 TaxID=1459636 RepID=A0A075MUU7_9ARCH|nr:DUF2524 family protein [Candidatus Nitrososphaera evergladensis]AIF85436.1 hypothetical protein NTE_03408 [Candidatus Nitrososphaera evergladensis SR1]